MNVNLSSEVESEEGMEKHTNNMHNKDFFKLLSIKQFMKVFVLQSFSFPANSMSLGSCWARNI